MGKQSNSVDNIFLNRPTIKDYISLEGIVKNDVDRVITVLKPNMILRIKSFELKPKKVDLWDLSWSDLILLREMIKEKNISGVLELIYSVSQEKFLELDVFNCFAVYKWINEQLNELYKVWSENLHTEPTQKEKDAGVENFNDFGDYATLETLTKGDSLKDDYYLNKPAHYIYRKLCYNKVNAEYTRAYYKTK